MRPQPVMVGPFTGGINQYSDPSAIDDSEVSDCINFELDMDGSLVCRNVLRKSQQTGIVWSTNIEIIGSGVWPNSVRLFGSNSSGTYALENRTGAWVKISNNVYNVALQVAGAVCLVPETAGQGGYWSPSLGFLADSNIPRGRMAVYFKGRIWVAPGRNPPTDESTIRYSNPIGALILDAATRPTWNSTNFFLVQGGDGQDLTDLAVYQDQLVMFKSDSTYVHAYDAGDPKDGLIRCIHTGIGASSRDCVTQWEEQIFVMHQGLVYEIVNYNFQHINDKVPFVIDAGIPTDATSRVINVGLSIVEDRLICRYFNRIYVFGLHTRTWSRWESQEKHLQNVGIFTPWPTTVIRDTPLYYYAGSVISNYPNVIEYVEGRHADVFETWDGTTRLDINCKIVTKIIDNGDPFHFKKLAWWGVDVLTNTSVTVSATPIVISSGTTWEQAATSTWEELETWAQPLVASIQVDDGVITEAPVKRKFIKFLKALRYRQIYYTVEMTSDGSTVTGPCRLFTLTTIVGSKEQVVKKVS